MVPSCRDHVWNVQKETSLKNRSTHGNNRESFHDTIRCSTDVCSTNHFQTPLGNEPVIQAPDLYPAYPALPKQCRFQLKLCQVRAA
ncbi:hypothetical protein TNIN_146581 [Trichonephila inaurata madagascariensis]|uniref:Uncharacterized protein n=1 Tax=Trichonephila inaurata madagascariensis TaxID=2747483 RepID=A0A8X6YM88_9ARAC|nr:hypothetical protein TNIN_146581 [Trichonephila inaurata madagascariensis]